MLHIGLVQCYGSMQPVNAEPLSVETLMGFLEESLHDRVVITIFTLDEQEDHGWENLVNSVVEKEIRIVGVSIPQSSLPIAKKFLNALHALDRSPLIILGHSLPTNLPEEFLQWFPKSLIVNGWGEESFAKIVEFYLENRSDYETIPNLIFRENGHIVRTNVKRPHKSPKPARISPSRYFARIESSRGCHYNVCTFCTRPPKQGGSKSWRRFDVDDIVQEIRKVRSSGVRNFTFTDEDFVGNDLEGAEKIANYLAGLGDMKFSISLRVDNIIDPAESPALAAKRRGLLHSLKRAGLSRVFLGVESLSNSQLKRYGKGVTAQDSINAIHVLLELDIPIEIGFILFDPFLTISELEENVRWLRGSSAWKLVGQLFNHLRVQVNTPFARMLKTKGLLGDLDPNFLNFDYKFSNENIGRIARFCIDWKDHIDGVYAAARNVSRSELGDSDCDKFDENIRELQLNLLSYLLAKASEPSRLIVPETYTTELRRLVEELYASVQKRDNLATAPALRELKGAIESYFKNQYTKVVADESGQKRQSMHSRVINIYSRWAEGR